jgi:thiamine kinase-like enzyme
MAAEIPPDRRLNEVPAWALAQVPGVAPGVMPDCIERLGGGTVNEVFRVVSRAGEFVLRLDGASWRRPGVDRVRELALHQIAAAAGVAPAILRALPAQQGLLITQWHPGRTWRAPDYEDVAALRRLGERLSVLHRLPAPTLPPFDPLSVARSYLTRSAPAEASAAAPIMRRLEALCDCLATSGQALCVIHGDLWEGNLLESDRLWLLDWEYAQLSDPLMDVACLLAYYPAASRYRNDLMAAAQIPPAAWSGLRDRVDIYRILSWLWQLARGEGGQPPQGIGGQDW